MPAAMKSTPSRGEDTRRKLLEHAIALFAANGYKAVSTRAIAQAAGVNHAGIGFHFQGKSGLHQGAIDEMVREFSGICRTFALAVDLVLHRPDPGKDALRQALRPAVERFVITSVATDRMRLLNRLYLQEQLLRSRAADQVYDQVARPVLGVLERLAVAAGAAAAGSLEAKALAVSILTLMTVYGREAALLENHLGEQAGSPAFRQALARVAVEGACGMLGL